MPGHENVQQYLRCFATKISKTNPPLQEKETGTHVKVRVYPLRRKSMVFLEFLLAKTYLFT